MQAIAVCRIGFSASSAFALLAVLLLPGCGLHHLPPRTAVGDEGAAGIHVSGVAENRKLQTFSILPGPNSIEVAVQKASCTEDGIQVQVWSAVQDVQQAMSVCHAASRAASVSLDAAGMAGARVKYRVTLVSDGGGTWRHPGSARAAIPSLAFWFPAQQNLTDRVLARIVRTTAHEFHHAAWALNGSPRKVYAGEPAAYAAGACAQLAVLGRLRREWLPLAHDWMNDALPDKAAMRSSRAGADLHVSLLPFFDGADEIQPDSRPGRAVMAWCACARVVR